ncbi:8385_t:CDS:1, partial [Racocetra persica]
LYAVIRALETCQDQTKVIEIKSDSRFVVNSLETWIHKWKKNGWKTVKNQDVKNRDLFEKIDFLLTKRPGDVYFSYVFGHKGIPLNELADKLAKQGAAIKMNESKKLSPYNAFMKANLPIVKKNNPDLEHKDAFKLVVSMWNETKKEHK